MRVALLVIDMQHDFIHGSPSQDDHPEDHISFADTHNTEPFQERCVAHPIIPEATLLQMMWPKHCVQNTKGAEIVPSVKKALQSKQASGTPVYYVRKGQDARIDYYSAFASQEYVRFTELSKLLHSQQPCPIDTVVVCGIATDYCVKNTAIDACKFGFRTQVANDCIRGVFDATSSAALREMQAYGCEMV
ncbi:hypothetical protein MVES1_002596 [Malassezia vespertilionis]|uniref:uncharacterized protein n=1 Tax=Malassezia vespertilionis TaxID=2020962 RepID=UPI0024B04262|nr:uncharacterized protein MVES1_002596 [Malassezia vespertilionis]WFD07236.1 hypothetical protein MVES1_002596 [Malassezia vespertilionis]